MSGVDGTSIFLAVGIVDRSLLPMSSSAGLYPLFSGVVLYASSVLYGSPVFSIDFLMIFNSCFSQAVALRAMGTECDMLEAVLLSKCGECRRFHARELRTVVRHDNLRYPVAGKDALTVSNHCFRGEIAKQCYFRVPREIVRNDEPPLVLMIEEVHSHPLPWPFREVRW